MAGHQELGNLSSCGTTTTFHRGRHRTAVSEDTVKRYEAYGWHVQRVARTGRRPRPARISNAVEARRSDEQAVVHRDALDHRLPRARAEHRGRRRLGARRRRVAATKRVLGLDPEKSFDVSDDSSNTPARRGARPRGEGRVGPVYQEWPQQQPGARGRVRPIRAGERRPLGRAAPGLSRRASPSPPVPRRQGAPALGASSRSCGALGGPRGFEQHDDRQDVAFLPADNPLPEGEPYGRTIHFGNPRALHGRGAERHHAHGNTRAYGGTFSSSPTTCHAVRLFGADAPAGDVRCGRTSPSVSARAPDPQPVEHLASAARHPGSEPWSAPPTPTETAIACARSCAATPRCTARCPARFLADRQGGAGRKTPTEDNRQGEATCCSGVNRNARGDPIGTRFRGAPGRRGPRAARDRRCADARRVHALRGVVRRAGPGYGSVAARPQARGSRGRDRV